MASAFNYAGYDYKFVVGEGTHSVRHGATILPDALRWIWHDYPAPIRVNPASGSKQMVRAIVDPLEPWRPAEPGTAEPAKPPILGALSRGLMPGDRQFRPAALASADDGSYIFAAEPGTPLVWSFQIARPKGPRFGEPFCHLESSDEDAQPAARALAADRDGSLYASTALGIQICDTQGRAIAILNQPPPGVATKLWLSSGTPPQLLAQSGGRIFRRKMLRLPPAH